MAEFIYRGDTGELKQWLRRTFQPGIAYALNAEVYRKKRTLDQNGQLRVWYGQITNELKDDDAQGWERYCKLHHGCPIMCAKKKKDDEDMSFKEFCEIAIEPLSYENRLKAMDHTPVTRNMKTNQFNLYFAALQEDFFNRGVNLEFLK